MPLTSIDIHENVYDAAARQKISDALHEAMKEVLQIPDDDRLHVFTEHPEATMLHDDVIFGEPRDERLMFVTFSFNDREPEVKQKLYAAAVRRLGETAGVRPSDVMFRVLETASANWWASGRSVDPGTGYDVRMPDAATT